MPRRPLDTGRQPNLIAVGDAAFEVRKHITTVLPFVRRLYEEVSRWTVVAI
jgi:hypothetical protein